MTQSIILLDFNQFPVSKFVTTDSKFVVITFIKHNTEIQLHQEIRFWYVSAFSVLWYVQKLDWSLCLKS